MKSKIQKTLAAKIAKTSKNKVRLVTGRLEEIKEAITRSDVRALIKNGAIQIVPKKGVSRVRARKKQVQKSKGRQKGHGSRKGRANARANTKEKWMNKIRLQRVFLRDLRDRNRISKETYKDLYLKSKGGFFRSKRHVKLYITEHKLIQDGN